LLAPWAYRAAQALAGPPGHTTSGWLDRLKATADAPFHRYLSRSFLLVAVIGLWPLLRAFRLHTWAGVGLGRERGFWRLGLAGFGAGLGTLAVVAVLAVVMGARRFETSHSATDYCVHCVNAGLAAVFVAVLEELLFRGALFGGLRAAHGWKVGLAASSLVFALVHFLERVELTGPVQWNSGLALLPPMLRGFAAFDRMIPAFLNLAVVGAILALAYQRTGNLYFSIGLHGGWIFWVKSFGFMSVETPAASQWFWGTGKLIDGWMALAGLVIALVLIMRWFPGHEAPKVEELIAAKERKDHKDGNVA
jgi:membrane protease YdiL (CAAX protease family)